MAPIISPRKYFHACEPLIVPWIQKPSVTAGLRCAPEKKPTE